MLGFHPTDSAVLVALHGESGRFGGRVRVGLPASPQEWPDIADQLAECLVTGSERRGPRPDGIVVFLCQDPSRDGSARQVMERLRPLAQRLRVACGSLDVPVLEALCISDGRYWSYCCPDSRCCPPEGSVLALPGTSVMAAAATYAGLQVRGSLREMEERFAPLRYPAAQEQERALDAAAAQMFPRVLGGGDRRGVADETLDLAARLMRRIARAPAPARGADGRAPAGRGAGALLTGRNAADELDDGLIAHDEAAALILGLQDRTTRDWAAEWMEGAEAQPALRLWRALARRCVGPYREHAAALLTLAGWVSWSTGTTRTPGWRSAWPCARTRSTASPTSCTRPATRAWTPRSCASACGRNARRGEGARRRGPPHGWRTKRRWRVRRQRMARRQQRRRRGGRPAPGSVAGCNRPRAGAAQGSSQGARPAPSAHRNRPAPGRRGPGPGPGAGAGRGRRGRSEGGCEERAQGGEA